MTRWQIMEGASSAAGDFETEEDALRWARSIGFRKPAIAPLTAPPMSDRQQIETELRAKAPLRPTASQADAGHLPLFIAANEPTFL